MIWGIVLAVVSIVGSVVMQKKMEKDMQDQQAGFLVSKSGGSNPLRIIYGKRRVGTDNVWKGISRSKISESTSNADSFYTHSGETSYQETRDDEDYLHRLDVWCLGPVESIGNFKVDDDKLTHTRFVNSKSSRPLVRILNKHGAASQTAFPALVSGMSEIGSNMKGNDVAYSWSRFLYIAPSPDFQGEPNLTAEIEGMKVWDPRTHPSSPSVKSWSNNPALCLLDYLTADYGKGLSVDDLDLPSFISAAYSCEGQVLLPADTTVLDAGYFYNPINGEQVYLNAGDTFPWHRTGQATSQSNRYSTNLILESKNSAIDNVKEILKTMKGSLPFIQGKYKLVLEETGTSVYTFDDSNILGSVSVSFADRSKRLNRCTVKFPNENKGYKSDTVSWPSAGSSLHTGYVNQDNGEDLHTEIELTGTTDTYQARDLAEFTVRDSRTQEFIDFKAQPSALILECGDIITVSNDILDIVNQPYRIRTLKINGDLTVSIKAQVYDTTVYPWNLTDADAEAANLEYAPSAFNDPLDVQNFSGAGATNLNQDGTAVSRIAVVWDPIVSGTASVDFIEVGIKESTSTEYTYVTLPPYATQHIFQGLPDLTAFDLTIRYRNVLGKSSDDVTTTVTTPDQNTTIGTEDAIARLAAQAAQDAADAAAAAAAAAQADAANAAITAAAAQTAQEVLDAIAADTTVVDGSRIVTGSIDAADINATTQMTVGVSPNNATISGSDSSYRLWVGANSASSAPFAVKKDGELVVKSATSGERLEVTGNAVKVYDANGNLRVKLGNLN